MSDSTPTEPLGSPATKPLPAPAGAAAPAADTSRRTIIILLSVGGALLLAVAILLVVLLGRGTPTPAPVGSETPSASPTPTETRPSPSPTPSETEEDGDDDNGGGNSGNGGKNETSNGAIASFEASTAKVDCSNGGSVPVHFEWQADGVNLWFGIGTDNAKTAPYGSYNLVDELDVNYQCGQSGKQQRYTVTVELANGDINSATLIIKE